MRGRWRRWRRRRRGRWKRRGRSWWRSWRRWRWGWRQWGRGRHWGRRHWRRPGRRWRWRRLRRRDSRRRRRRWRFGRRRARRTKATRLLAISAYICDIQRARFVVVFSQFGLVRIPEQEARVIAPGLQIFACMRCKQHSADEDERAQEHGLGVRRMRAVAHVRCVPMPPPVRAGLLFRAQELQSAGCGLGRWISRRARLTARK